MEPCNAPNCSYPPSSVRWRMRTQLRVDSQEALLIAASDDQSVDFDPSGFHRSGVFSLARMPWRSGVEPECVSSMLCVSIYLHGIYIVAETVVSRPFNCGLLSITF